MTDELKPCPFCGGEAWLSTPKLPMVADCDDVQVSCIDCAAIGPSILFDQDVHSVTDLPNLEADAITAWNTRAEDTALQQRVRELEEALQPCAVPI